MGIDAEMVIRNVREAVVTDEWLKEMSWQLVRAIRSAAFFISDGLPPEQYQVANDAWRSAFNAHPLYAEFCATKDHKELSGLHENILADIGKPPEMLQLAIEKTNRRYREDDDLPAGKSYSQDGDAIIADPSECMLEVSLSGRYYGIGYERGDILTYCAIAEWLEINIPGCVVLYGGDSSGVCAEPFNEAERQKLRRHLFSPQGRDYFSHFDDGSAAAKPPACGMCPGGKYRGIQHGFGGDGHYAAFNCPGCGKSVESRDGCATWQKSKD